MPELQQAIESLTAKAKRLLAGSNEVGEENTKAVLIEPMLQALGWDTHDLDQVQRQYRYKPQDNPVDYALFIAAQPRLFVEAKRLGRDVGEHKWRVQTVNYANTAGVDWCVITDGNFWHLYKSNAPGDLDQKLFLETFLHSPKGEAPPYPPSFVLSLLSQDKLKENEISTRWKLLHVDRVGQDTFTRLVTGKDPGLVRLLQKSSDLTKREVEAFLDRVRVSIETPLASLGDVVDKPPPRVELPKASEVELPLLRAILQRGGQINLKSQGSIILDQLGDEFRLTSHQRQSRTPDSRYTVWSCRIHAAREHLVRKGEMDKSHKGIWALTDKGRRRAERGD